MLHQQPYLKISGANFLKLGFSPAPFKLSVTSRGVCHGVGQGFSGVRELKMPLSEWE